MHHITQNYLIGLQAAYAREGHATEWQHFESIKHGAAQENLSALRQTYPDIPDSLISLLEYVDGTYWREYAGEKISFFFLGSDVKGYPYYLLSSKEIVANQRNADLYFGEIIIRQFKGVEVDEKITQQSSGVLWLHFADCLNNGGTSQLFVDFSPSPKGVKGQVVRYLHDPDEIKVIADSFDAYLAQQMEDDYHFINKDVLE